jgi:hypothetical protein
VLFGDGQVVGLKGPHVSVDGFPDIRERGFLRLTLAYATGQAGAFGHPEPVFPTIDQDLAHVLIVHDFRGSGGTGCARFVRDSTEGEIGIAITTLRKPGARAGPWALLLPRIEDRDPGFVEIAAVASDYRQPMFEGGGRQHQIGIRIGMSDLSAVFH